MVFVAVMAPVSGAGPSFRPDDRFQGSTLAGWHPQGEAGVAHRKGRDYRRSKTPAGGWLVLDRSYQDAEFFARSSAPPVQDRRSPAGRENRRRRHEGHLSLAERGRCGTLIRVALDARGSELKRTPLRFPGGGRIRIAPPPAPAAAPAVPPGAAGRGAGRGGGLPDRVRPAAQHRAPPWRSGTNLEILLDANIIRTFVNNAGPSGVADDDAGRYGPVALYVGGSGGSAVQGHRVQGPALRTRPEEKVSSRFRMQRLSDFYYALGRGRGRLQPRRRARHRLRPAHLLRTRLPPQPGNLPGDDLESVEPVRVRLLDAVRRRFHRRWLGRRITASSRAGSGACSTSIRRVKRGAGTVIAS